MFRNRTSSLKPDANFISNFRQNFPEVNSTTVGSASGTDSENSSLGDAVADKAVDPSGLHSLMSRKLSAPLEDIGRDLDPTPKAQHEPWRFTPSLLDPNSFAFSHFANQPPGYYTPTSAGTNALFHSQAGDLHTPGMGIGMGLGTPLSMPTLDHGVQAGSMMDMSAFTPQQMQPPHFHNYNNFGQHQEHHQQSSFAPSSFVHQDTGYETMDHEGSPMEEDRRMSGVNSSMNSSPLMTFEPQSYQSGVLSSMPISIERFRFHVTLNAPTAMIKSANEIPITYLNKGQAYSFSIVDTAPQLAPVSPGTRYRTFVRISFEDEQQRQRPAFCWGLWKEGRGTNEAHQRGGKLQAVEYVEAQPVAESEERTRVELDTASFDGFSVIWTPGANASPECHIAVRFNFLSTDFSHSKGVKGIPVRLCAKTEVLTSGSPHSTPERAEVAYCKVKLFRDHGAERKLSNDVAHVKKTIDKLKQQISQVETGVKDFGKRKRGTVVEKVQPSQRPGKVQKHRRTWSLSSASSSGGGGGRLPREEDLHFKLQTMQDMFTSTRPVSVLYLRGKEQDDPDLHPVILPGEPLDLTKATSQDSIAWQHRVAGLGSVTGSSSLISPSSSSASINSQIRTGTLGSNSSWTALVPSTDGSDTQPTPQQLASPPDQITKIGKLADDEGSLSGWIEALGVDPSYKPPNERPAKPTACFYVLHREQCSPSKHEYHRAIYLPRRTLVDFNNCIAMKWNIEPTRILRTLHVLPRGLEIDVDDDFIRELPEGQDIIMEIAFIQNAPSVKDEWDMSDVTDAEADSTDGSGRGTSQSVYTEGYQLRLIF